MKSFLAILFAASTAFAAPSTGDFRINWWDHNNSMQNVVVEHASPLTSPAFLLQHGTYGNPDLVTFGASLSYDSGTDSVGVSASWLNSAIDSRGASNGYATSATLANYLLTSNFTWANLSGKPSAFPAAWADITGKPSFFSGAYADLTGKPTLFSGAYGDLSGVPSTFTPAAHIHAQSDITGLVAALAGKEAAVTAGTTGQYYRGDKTWQTFPTIPTNTNQLTNGAGFLTAEVDGSVTNEIELPTQTGQSGKFLTTNGTSPSWATPTATAWTFSTPTFSSATTATQLSATRNASVRYDIDATVTISLLAGQSVTANLHYADDSGMSTNLVLVSSQTTSNSGVLGLTQSNSLKLEGDIPPAKYRRVTFSTTGTGTATPSTLKAGQEVLK